MLDEREILTIVSDELSQAAGGNENDFIDSNRQDALATYLGQKETVPEGRSSVVSTDVADAIEWIMPELVKAFTQNNDVVTFDACFSGDEKQAELESRYVYDILMKDNEGFLIIHQFIKDALMQKNGFIKVFYEKDDTEHTEIYTGLTEVEYNVIAADPDIEILEQSVEEVQGIPVFDVKVVRYERNSKVSVVSVPPEEFRVNRMHNSVDLSSARFTAHVTLKTKSDLIIEGHDKDIVDGLVSTTVYDNDRDYRFYMQGETVSPGREVTADESQDLIEVAECYMRIDLNEDGISELVKITTAGGNDNEPSEILSIEEIEEIPFISTTAILMSHKLFGLSIYDRLKEIQEQKTALWRNIFDNMYLQNNQRTIVMENQVNLDDLLISRPGGIVRVKRPDALQPLATPQLPADSYKMMDYLDQVRAGRAGVSPEGHIQDQAVGDRVGSEGIDRIMNQKEELVGLMVRVVAETGIKPLCYRIRNLVMRHQDVARDYVYRGQWVKVDPRRWRSRVHSTVRVGTGSGNRKDQMQTLSALAQMQESILNKPGQVLVRPNEVFSLADHLAKLGGLPGANPYILDPESPQGQQHAKMSQQQMEQEKQKEEQKDLTLLKAQTQVANAEGQKAITAKQNVHLTAQAKNLEQKLEAAKIAGDQEAEYLKQRLDELQMILDERQDNKELEFKRWDREEYYKVEREKISAQKTIASQQPEGNSDD